MVLILSFYSILVYVILSIIDLSDLPDEYRELGTVLLQHL